VGDHVIEGELGRQ
jgi:hypothetical protein